MKVENSKELDTWLFEHANILGHKCDGIKGTVPEDPSSELVNVKYVDTKTGEEFHVVYSDDSE